MKRIGMLDRRLFAQMTEGAINFVDTGGAGYPMQHGVTPKNLKNAMGLLQKREKDSSAEPKVGDFTELDRTVQLWENYFKRKKKDVVGGEPEDVMFKKEQGEGESGGKWVTIGGHHILIKDGETEPEGREKVAIGGGEVGRYLALQSLGQPRKFNSFPGDVWDKKAKFFDIKTRDILKNSEAKVRFNRGETVGYISGGFVRSVIKDPEGHTPSI